MATTRKTTTTVEHDIKLTPTSRQLFADLAADAGNWSGAPLLDIDRFTRGNVTQLKKAALITTQVDSENKRCVWVTFTDAGVAYAQTLGYDLTRFYPAQS
jgi:hypothetical protein